MGFFGSLFGSDQRKDMQAADRRATQILTQREAQARGELQQGITDQLNSLQGGYGTARTGLQSGYDTARGALNTGYDTARGDVSAGYDRAIAAQNDYLQRTGNILNPYLQHGQQAGDQYANYMGLNGEGARQSAIDAYRATNPLTSEVDDRANEETLRALNSRGITGGREALAVTRSAQQRGEDRLNGYLNRLQGMYQSGQNAAGQLAGYTDATGQRIGGYESGRGTTLGTLEASRGTGLSNLAMQNGGNLANLDYRYGSDRGGIQAGQGNSLANLSYGVGQQLAGNQINLGNAVAQSRTQGVSNILNGIGTLAGAAFAGFAPTASGMSAFGNIRNGLTGGGFR